MLSFLVNHAGAVQSNTAEFTPITAPNSWPRRIAWKTSSQTSRGIDNAATTAETAHANPSRSRKRDEITEAPGYDVTSDNFHSISAQRIGLLSDVSKWDDF
jgi:hypothetical protein